MTALSLTLAVARLRLAVVRLRAGRALQRLVRRRTPMTGAESGRRWRPYGQKSLALNRLSNGMPAFL